MNEILDLLAAVSFPLVGQDLIYVIVNLAFGGLVAGVVGYQSRGLRFDSQWGTEKVP